MSHNIRFPEIWQILTEHINFNGKTLIDIGCGYGDLLKTAYEAGSTVYGVDKDISLINKLQKYITENFYLVCHDIDYLEDNQELPEHVDILTCFSVLPYLQYPDKVLRYFRQLSDITIIECQYSGDGPGFASIKNDNDMVDWLSSIWDNVEKIGQTEVVGRGYRSIWLCQDC